MENEIQISEADGQRLDTYLQSRLPLSRQKIQAFIKSGHITLNKKKVKPAIALQDNDLVYINVPAQQDEEKEQKLIHIDIVHEDDDILVINKPVGVIVQRNESSDEPSVIDHLKAMGKSFGAFDDADREGIVHRLDRMTEGLLIIAKNKEAHEALSEQFKQRSVTKKYYALLKGNVLNDEMSIHQPIDRDPKKRHRYLVLKSGKEAISELKVLKRFNSMTLTEWQIKTGRTHQIRVHAKFIGHPVLDDETYGVKSKGLGQRLQAYYLAFQHPNTKKEMNFELKLSERLQS